tara:strand:- start:90 stop:269 length:180 start_codon:yes stop_codon:yes gene_type:complete
MRYSVELREYFENGEDYVEKHYDFETIEETIVFASKNGNQVHSVLDYEDRDHNPKYINT